MFSLVSIYIFKTGSFILEFRYDVGYESGKKVFELRRRERIIRKKPEIKQNLKVKNYSLLEFTASCFMFFPYNHNRNL